jgi:hypothetical protein
MSTSTHGDLKLVRPCKIESDRDIVSIFTACDHGRSAVDEGIEAAAGCVVFGRCRIDHSASQRMS